MQSSGYVGKSEGISKHKNMQHIRGNVIKRSIKPIDHCLHAAVISTLALISEKERETLEVPLTFFRRPYVT